MSRPDGEGIDEGSLPGAMNPETPRESWPPWERRSEGAGGSDPVEYIGLSREREGILVVSSEERAARRSGPGDRSMVPTSVGLNVGIAEESKDDGACSCGNRATESAWLALGRAVRGARLSGARRSRARAWGGAAISEGFIGRLSPSTGTDAFEASVRFSVDPDSDSRAWGRWASSTPAASLSERVGESSCQPTTATRRAKAAPAISGPAPKGRPRSPWRIDTAPVN